MAQKGVIRDIQFSVNRGELVIVAGSVGCGKSTLLLSMLGELVDCSENVSSGKGLSEGLRVAYCAQKPWIMATTVKNNICLGRAEFDSNLYSVAVESSRIVEDLDMWPDFDNTEIGERGISVSGGQKARISLARAVYADADLYLLDDPLAAVDAHVGKALFFDCILSTLVKRNKGVVLVTHQLQYLPYAAKVLLLSDNGKQEFYGSFAELQAKWSEFPILSLVSVNGNVLESSDYQVERRKFVSRDVYDVKSLNESKDSKESTDRTSVILAEKRVVGNIGWDVYWQYATNGGLFNCGVAVFTCLLTQVVVLITEYWLRWWATNNFFNSQRSAYYVWIYAILVVVCVLLAFGRSLAWFSFTLKASSSLHDKALWALMRSPMAFFVANPTGRILNRFAKDQNQVDELLASSSFDFLQTALFCLSGVVLACISVPYIVILIPILLLFFVYLRRRYIASTREVKRLEALLRSPVYAWFSATLDGLITLRAYRLQDHMTHEFHTYLNSHGRSWISFVMCARWLGFRLDLISALIVIFTAILGVVLRHSVDVGLLGFALVYATSLSGLFQWTVRQSAEVENQMTSVERLVEYAQLPAEAGYGVSAAATHDVRANFCTNCFVPENKIVENSSEVLDKCMKRIKLIDSVFENTVFEIKDLVVSYREDLEAVLNGVSISIPASYKVGICGRTGCGKSSLLQALLRLNRINSGDIRIVGRSDMDSKLLESVIGKGISLVHDVDLETCRGLIALIPQDPHLFSGTIRYNLDPFSLYTDAEIWDALEQAHFKDFISESNNNDESKSDAKSGLDRLIEGNGTNLSAGQRQLLSLARAILRKCRIILMDEVSASVDFVTDRLIQETIRSSPCLKHATIITVAHRLRTIADNDLIVVIDKGRVVECGSPSELLAENSQFRKLAVETGELADILQLASSRV